MTHISAYSFASEKQLQAHCFQWTWNMYPELRRLFFKVNNDGEKNIVAAVQDRGLGIVRGIPDLVFMVPAMGIELKMPGKKQTEDQIKVEVKWKSRQIPYYLVFTVEQYQEIVIREVDKIKWW